MESIGLNEVGNALVITLILLAVAIVIVGLAMWGLYKFFSPSKAKSDTPTEKETR